MTDAKALAEQIEDWLCEGSCKHFEICNGTETTWCGQRTQQILALFASTAPQALAATPADDDLVPRLEDHGLFNKAERNALFKEAKDEIVRLRTALAATPAVGGETLTDEIIDLSLSEFWDVSPRGWNEAQRVAMRKAILTAQPASPLRGRDSLIEQCAKIAEPWSGFIDADKMGAADNAVIKVRNDIATAIRSLSASPPEQPAAAPAAGREAVTDRNLRDQLCGDCPPVGYPTDETRCLPCPRRDLTRVDLVRFGEPVWPNNDEANDLDKGSDA